MPLILAFYCIVGGGQLLPEFRRDLYVRVLKRMLTGRWRGSHERQANVDTCLQMLQAWAWSGAASHPVSGVGMWADDIPTERGWLREADEEALDHVATPVGPPDVDTGMTLRRFIHRSIREHLVAEHIARLPVDEAAEALLPHLWYDADWEYAAPAALAAHPQSDQLLRAVVGRAVGSDQIPGELSVIDGGWEFRGLLARVASESSEADWSPEIAEMIGRARVELAWSGHADNLGGAARWGTFNRQARAALLEVLACETDNEKAAALAGGLIHLDPTAEDRRQARETLLGLLACEARGFYAAKLADAVDRLAPAAEDRRQARAALLGLLALKADGTTGLTGKELVSTIARLAPTAEDRRQARSVLLALLVHTTHSWSAPTLADAVEIQLIPTAEDKRQADETLMTWEVRITSSLQAAASAGGGAELDPTAEDKRQADETVVRWQARITSGLQAVASAGGVVELDPTAEDKRQARGALLRMLGAAACGSHAGELAKALVRLDPTAEDKRQARGALLEALARETDSWDVADGLVQLDPTLHDLSSWHASAVPLPTELLTAVRRNSAIADWLAALSWMSVLSVRPR